MLVRLNKLISVSGICSRREADELIKEGRVSVNDKIANVGDRVSETDIVTVDGERVRFSKALYEEMDAPKVQVTRRSAVAQKMAASPKSAALRKTSRNNPVNRAARKWERKQKESGNFGK